MFLYILAVVAIVLALVFGERLSRRIRAYRHVTANPPASSSSAEVNCYLREVQSHRQWVVAHGASVLLSIFALTAIAVAAPGNDAGGPPALGLAAGFLQFASLVASVALSAYGLNILWKAHKTVISSRRDLETCPATGEDARSLVRVWRLIGVLLVALGLLGLSNLAPTVS